MFCVFCLTNTGFVQCYSLGSHKVCRTLVLYFALFSNFLFCVLCLTNFEFVQYFSFGSRKNKLHSLGSRKVCRTLLFNLFYSAILVLRALPHKHRLCAVLFPRLPSSLLHACVYFALFSNFLPCVFCLTIIRLVQCFSLRLPSSLHPFVFLCFIQFAFVMRALPNKLRFGQ